MADDLGDDDDTVIEAWEHETPVEVPRCVECGRIVFVDNFDDVSLVIGLDRCVRSKTTAANPWHWCANYSKTHMKLVKLVPR